ncbi:MAG: M20/M25/M40 family metallo-hydrolase [Candidatus Hodarchaeales archaeon]|jgi:succinyl-diaminopimelate desuccinylase
MLDLLSELVSFKTVSKAHEDEKEEKRKCAIYLASYLKDIGLDVQVSDKTNTYNDVTSYNIIASKNVSDKAITVALLGHFDVVPALESEWEYDPFRLTVKDGKAYGRGTTDMKGSLVAGIKAIETIIKREIPLNILVLYTSDEETGGKAGMGYVIDKLETIPNYAINGDGNGNKVINRRRNVFLVKIITPREFKEVRGKSTYCTYSTVIFERETSHAAYFLPYLDTHALLKTSQFLNSNENIFLLNFDEKSFIKNNVLPSQVMFEILIPNKKGEKRYVDINMNKVLRSLVYLSQLPIQSGFSYYGVTITPNVVKIGKKDVTIEIDVRANLREQKVLEQVFQKFIKLQKLPVVLEINGSPSPLETREDSILVQTACEIQRQLVPDRDPGPHEMGGASDSRYFTPKGIQTIDYGVSGGNLHGENEYVSIKSMLIAKEFYTLLFEKLSNGVYTNKKFKS